MQKTEKIILFIGDYKPFINILKNEGYHIVTVPLNTIHLEKTIWLVKPTFIIQHVDTMEFNGIDPIKYVPNQFMNRTLTVSKTISPKELLNIVEKMLNRDLTKTPNFLD